MKRLIAWSIDHHWMVLALSILLAGAGLWTTRDMPVDVFPDLTAPTVTILTEGHGMAPEEMETLVTFPIEAAINGASDVRRVRSATAVGIAVVWVEFDWGTDIFLARQIVAEKLGLVSASLPLQAERPILAPISSIMGEILFFAISSETDDPLALRTVADTLVRRRLLAVSGVSQVTPIGGSERQFQVVAHPDQLRANSITVNELLDAVRGASQNTSAGVYMEGPQEYLLQTIGRARTPDEIADTVVTLRGDRSVLVRDIADVREGGAFKRGEGSRNGKPAVIVGVQKQPGANTVELTARLDRELDALQQELPHGMTIDRRIFRQSDFIDHRASEHIARHVTAEVRRDWTSSRADPVVTAGGGRDRAPNGARGIRRARAGCGGGRDRRGPQGRWAPARGVAGGVASGVLDAPGNERDDRSAHLASD